MTRALAHVDGLVYLIYKKKLAWNQYQQNNELSSLKKKKEKELKSSLKKEAMNYVKIRKR